MQGVPNRQVPPVASEKVWRTAKRPQSPPLGARGVFPCATQESSQMPRAARPSSQARRGAEEVLAAIVGTPADRRAPRESGDIRNGTMAAGDGYRGEVPRSSPDIPPPQGAAPRSLMYPPAWAQRAARAGGLKGTFLSPAKLICMRFSKNGLPAKTTRGGPDRRPSQGARPGELPGHCQARGEPPQVAYPIPQGAHPIPPGAYPIPQAPYPYTQGRLP